MRVEVDFSVRIIDRPTVGEVLQTAQRVRRGISEFVSEILAARRDPSIITESERLLVNPIRISLFKKKVETIEQVDDNKIVVGTNGKLPSKEADVEPKPAPPGTHERVRAAINTDRVIDDEYLRELKKFQEVAAKVIEKSKGKERFSGWVKTGAAALLTSLTVFALIRVTECNRQNIPTSSDSAASRPKPPEPEAVKGIIVKPSQEAPRESASQSTEIAQKPAEGLIEVLPERKTTLEESEVKIEETTDEPKEVITEVSGGELTNEQIVEKITPGYPVSEEIKNITGLTIQQLGYERYMSLLELTYQKHKDRFMASAVAITNSPYYKKDEPSTYFRALKQKDAIANLDLFKNINLPADVKSRLLQAATNYWSQESQQQTQVEQFKEAEFRIAA